MGVSQAMAKASRWLIFSCLLGLVLVVLGVYPVEAQDGEPTLVIEWPNEGETFYAGPTSLLYTIPIKGWVQGLEAGMDLVEVRLEIMQGATAAATLVEALRPDGSFEFLATVNPRGSDGRFPAEHLGCGDDCHRRGEVDLPTGRVTLKVTALNLPGGREATDERSITIDRSGSAAVPVKVMLDGVPGQPVSGVQVTGSTWLYIWRSRVVTGSSDENGLALIRVEALAESPTEHSFRVAPTIVDGVLYKGVNAAPLTLPPGASQADPIELRVRAYTGEVTGMLQGEGTAIESSPSILAIHLPSGGSRRVEPSPQGTFGFSPLPLGRYLIAADGEALFWQGLYSREQPVDLTETNQVEVELPVYSFDGRPLSGKVLDGEGGQPVPFAWITAENQGEFDAVSPEDGAFRLSGLPDERVTLLADAPGFYSQAFSVDPASLGGQGFDITLARQEETIARPWGSGEIVIPAGTTTSEEGGAMVLERGWLWGYQGDQPLSLQAGGTVITIPAGSFALEFLPGRRAWLYLLDGQAEVWRRDIAAPAEVNPGQMVNLLNPDPLEPVPCDPAVVAVLLSGEPPPLEHTWQPTLGAKVRDGLARAGVGAAQLITFFTYLLLLFSTVIAPVVTLYFWWRRRKLAAAVNRGDRRMEL